MGFFSPSGFDSVFKASQRIGFDITNNKTVVRYSKLNNSFY